MHGITERGATRWVFVRIYKSKTAANARRFLRDLERACPMKIRTILTDNGREFTARLFGVRKRAATGRHEFDQLCTGLGIEHRLAPPQHPQTNGMVPSHGLHANHCRATERFNGRIEEVLQSHHFRSGEELETTLRRYVVRRSLEPMAFTAHTHTTSSFPSQPWAAGRPCRR